MPPCSGVEQHVGYKYGDVAAKTYTTPGSYIAAESATASTATYAAPLNATGTYLPTSTTYTGPSYVPAGSAQYPSSTAITTSAPLNPAAAYTVKNAAPSNYTGSSYLPNPTTYTAPSSYFPAGSAQYPSSTTITTSAPLSPSAYTVTNAAPRNFTGTSYLPTSTTYAAAGSAHYPAATYPMSPSVTYPVTNAAPVSTPTTYLPAQPAVGTYTAAAATGGTAYYTGTAASTGYATNYVTGGSASNTVAPAISSYNGSSGNTPLYGTNPGAVTGGAGYSASATSSSQGATTDTVMV
jgi:hypothetical protein